MINSLRLKDFKNFVDETLRVGGFTVIVGANASGKSNIRDAFRFLHGIGRDYTLAEIVTGKFGVAGQIEWEPIRGNASEIIRFGQPAFGLEVGLSIGGEKATYSIEVSRELGGKAGFRITYERLLQGPDTAYEKPRSEYGDPRAYLGGNRPIEIALDRPILSQLAGKQHGCDGDRELVERVRDLLADMRFFEPLIDRTRLPSDPSQTVLGDRGENLAAVLHDIAANPRGSELLASWTRHLTPMDVKRLEFPVDAYDDRIRLFIQEANGRRVSAASASDGTLRFLMLLAAMLGPSRARFCCFEEIDTGIHAARLGILLNLIEQQTKSGQVQVMTTSHSGEMLNVAADSTFEYMSVVCRHEHSNDSIIRPVADLPNVAVLRREQGLGRLLAGGWMETALAFTEVPET